LLRPPELFLGLSNDFSGLFVVISSNVPIILCLVPAVTGLNFLLPSPLDITVKIYLISVLQGDDSLLEVVSATLQETGLGVAALEFAHVVHGVHIRHESNANLQLSCRNLPYVQPVLAQNVCTYDVMNASAIVMVEGAENVLNTMLA